MCAFNKRSRPEKTGGRCGSPFFRFWSASRKCFPAQTPLLFDPGTVTFLLSAQFSHHMLRDARLRAILAFATSLVSVLQINAELFAQAATQVPSQAFEAASVKPSEP